MLRWLTMMRQLPRTPKVGFRLLEVPFLKENPPERVPTGGQVVAQDEISATGVREGSRSQTGRSYCNRRFRELLCAVEVHSIASNRVGDTVPSQWRRRKFNRLLKFWQSLFVFAGAKISFP